MDVAADLDGRLELDQDRLREEDLAGVEAERADLALEEVDLLAGAGATYAQELVDDAIDVDGFRGPTPCFV